MASFLFPERSTVYLILHLIGFNSFSVLNEKKKWLNALKIYQFPYTVHKSWKKAERKKTRPRNKNHLKSCINYEPISLTQLHFSPLLWVPLFSIIKLYLLVSFAICLCNTQCSVMAYPYSLDVVDRESSKTVAKSPLVLFHILISNFLCMSDLLLVHSLKGPTSKLHYC